MRTCTGCEGDLGPMDAGYDVCMPCTRARAKAATTGGRCRCGRKRRGITIYRTMVRREKAVRCQRCLGSIEGWHDA